MSAAASIYFNHHTPSGQSRFYRGTQLGIDGVHCRESAGTGPVALKVVRVTGAAFASRRTYRKVEYVQNIESVSNCYYCCPAVLFFLWTSPPPRLMACTSVKSQMYTVQYHPLCVKTLSRLYCCCTVDSSPPPPRLMSVQVERVWCTRYNIIYCISKLLLLYLRPVSPPPPDLCLYKCKELELRVSSKLFTAMIMEK